MTGLPAELVSAILAEPEAEGPRLAAADWLEERGDADAARVLRLGARVLRRYALRLSTVEMARLRAEADGLIGRNRGRWVDGPLGATSGAGISTRWREGLLETLRVSTRCRVPALDVLSRVGAFPFLRTLEVVPPRPLPAEALSRVPDLPRLRVLNLHAEPPPGGRDEVLASFQRMPALEALSLEPNGPLFPQRGDHDTIRAARRERLAALPAADLPAALVPYTDRVTRARNGRLDVQTPYTEAGVQSDGRVMGRLPGLAVVALSTPDAPGWLAEHPDLRGLSLRDLTAFDPAPLAGLRELRYVEVSGLGLPPAGWDALIAWLSGLPELAGLSLHAPRRPAPDLTAGFPALRALRLINFGPAELSGTRLIDFAGSTVTPAREVPDTLRCLHTPIEDISPAERRLLRRAGVRILPADDDCPAVLGEPESVGTLNIRPPRGFVRLPPAPAAGGVETLATWAEWGDGDPLDRLPPGGPAWLTLERLPFKTKAAEVGPTLSAVPGELAAASVWAGLRREAGPPPRHEIVGECPFGSHGRALWVGKHSTLRLRLEIPRLRLLGANAVTAAVAGSLAWGGG